VLFRQAWEVAHIVKYSHERLSEFPEMDVENNPRLVIETLGDAGLRYRRRKAGNRAGNWVECRALPVDGVKDTAGAGDWCTAGLLSKVGGSGFSGFSATSDQELAAAIRFGQALAAWNCGFEGARGGMYAMSKSQFQKQINEILSGSLKAIPGTRTPISDSADSSSFCRVCEVSVEDIRKPTRRMRS
jgi:sugar/nucleoside kinase (ribokinase family)